MHDRLQDGVSLGFLTLAPTVLNNYAYITLRIVMKHQTSNGKKQAISSTSIRLALGLVKLICRELQFKTKKRYLTVHKWSIRVVIFISKEYSL